MNDQLQEAHQAQEDSPNPKTSKSHVSIQLPCQLDDSSLISCDAAPATPDVEQGRSHLQTSPSEQNIVQVEASGQSATSSAASGSGFSRGQHFNPEHDAILRVECLSARRLKVLLVFKFVIQLVATLFIILTLALVKTGFGSRVFTLMAVYCAIAAVCLALLIAMLGRWLHGFRLVYAQHKYWAKRRLRCTGLVAVQAAVEFVNLVFWMSSAAVGQHTRTLDNSFCPWSEFVQWTCWNTLLTMQLMLTHVGCAWTDREGRPVQHLLFCGSSLQQAGTRRNALVLDAPWRVHLPKLLFWLADALDGPDHQPQGRDVVDGTEDFREQIPACSKGPLHISQVALNIVASALYLLPHCWYVRTGSKDLRTMPYSTYRLGRTLMRLNISADMGVGSFVFFAVSLLLATILESPACVTCYQTLILGAAHLKAMALCMSGLYFMEPVVASVDNPQILQVWLQMFAWAERDTASILQQRAADLPTPQQRLMECEPVFCLEVAIKILYFAGMAYEHDEGRKVLNLSEERAMQLYGLKHLRLVRESRLDTKCLMAWNEDTLVLAFRGTASRQNAISDLKAWLTPLDGNKSQRSHRVKVHKGFHASWRLNGMRDKVTEMIRSEICPNAAAAQRMRVLFTGHSLGGALAVLAAWDLAPLFPWASLKVYTVGAPRPGNHAFAKAYDSRVPDTWHVINHRDPIPHMGKFLNSYKRPGQRVLIDEHGEMIVRPSALDMRLETLKGCGRISAHWLGSYRKAMVSVIKQQLEHTKFDDGLDGILQLAESISLGETLLAADLDVTQHMPEGPAARVFETAAGVLPPVLRPRS